MAELKAQKLISLLKNNGFLQTVNGSGVLALGPGLTLLRQNVLNLWQDRMVIRAESSYPVEGHHSVEPLSYFPEVFSLISRQVPFSVAYTAFKQSLTDTSEQLKPFYNFGQEKSLMFLHFCPQTSVSTAFDQVVNGRLTWWKQFSYNSSDITLEDMQQTEGVQSGRCVRYNFPWGPETIETISLMSEEHIKLLEDRTKTQCKYQVNKKSAWPSHIQTETSLEMCTAVYLCDAFVEEEDRRVLHLHTAVAPYKCAICRDGEHHREIEELATYISSILRKEGIKIVDLNGTRVSLEDQFNRHDEMGIPFSVVVSDEMIETGTVRVRNRDTTILETMAMWKLPVHLSKHVFYQPET